MRRWIYACTALQPMCVCSTNVIMKLAVEKFHISSWAQPTKVRKVDFYCNLKSKLKILKAVFKIIVGSWQFSPCVHTSNLHPKYGSCRLTDIRIVGPCVYMPIHDREVTASEDEI